jgi:thiamine-phosphate pyrophosphorylase
MNPLPARLLMVTDRHQAARPVDDVVAQALRAGVRWIWLRDRDLAATERRELAARLLALVRRVDARLTIGGDLELAVAIGADALQISAGASIAEARRRLGPQALIGVSAHGEADIAAARIAGADYVTLSPIYATSSKPGYGPALGPDAITRATRHGIPILALGGVTADRAAECRRAGAVGVAVMGELMRAAASAGGVAAAVQSFSRALAPEMA